MPETIVIADTSCLILLTKIRCVHVLQQLYKEVIITEEIASEFGEELPDWIKIQSVSNRNYMKILSLRLDLGESSAIALAIESGNVLLILDDV